MIYLFHARKSPYECSMPLGFKILRTVWAYVFLVNVKGAMRETGCPARKLWAATYRTSSRNPWHRHVEHKRSIKRQAVRYPGHEKTLIFVWQAEKTLIFVWQAVRLCAVSQPIRDNIAPQVRRSSGCPWLMSYLVCAAVVKVG